MRVLIVGAGQAGVAAAFALRDAAPTAAITVVGEEPELPYERPPLSKGLFGAEGPQVRELRPHDAWAAADIELRLGERVTAIDREARRVSLAGASPQSLAYDYLVVATGMRARSLGAVGSDRVAVIRTAADARRIHGRRPRSLGVVGSGFLAVEAARAAAGEGIDTTLYLHGERPLEGRVSPVLADYLARAHEAAGVRLVPRAGLEDPRDARLAAHDLVVAAVGASPADDLLLGAGLTAEVDAHLRTADPRIFVIGDLALAPAWRSPGVVRHEAENPARFQGEFLGAALPRLAAGEEVAPFDAVPWHWSLQGPTRVLIAGALSGAPGRAAVGGATEAQAPRPTPPGPADVTSVTRIEDVLVGSGERFQVLRFQDGVLRVVETVGPPAPHAVARRLLAAGTLPTPAQAKEPGFALKGFARTVG